MNIGLGSDSGNYSDYFDIGRQAYLAVTIHREARGEMPTISGEQALETATINGARAMGLATELGSIEVGKRAEIVIHGSDRPEWHPGLDLVNSLIYSAQSGGITNVIVGGRVIVDDGRSATTDEVSAYERIDASARALFRAATGAGHSSLAPRGREDEPLRRWDRVTEIGHPCPGYRWMSATSGPKEHEHALDRLPLRRDPQ